MRTIDRFLLATVLVIGCLASAANASESLYGTGPPGEESAPSVPFRCELKRGAWCIRQGSVEITKLQRVSVSEPSGTTWRLRDIHYPSSILVVLEPSACTHGYADTVEARGIEYGVDWDGRRWDKMTVRLRKDGSCDLSILVTPFHDEASEWAFFDGRTFIAGCKDEACLDPLVPTPSDVTSQYRDGFRGAGH